MSAFTALHGKFHKLTVFKDCYPGFLRHDIGNDTFIHALFLCCQNILQIDRRPPHFPLGYKQTCTVNQGRILINRQAKTVR